MAEDITSFLFPEGKYKSLSAFELVSKWEGEEEDNRTIGDYIEWKNQSKKE